jgi:hypothetical protein
MHMMFEVGSNERHQVNFDFDQTWGKLTISVDGNVLVKQRILISVSLVRQWEFDVGSDEVHHVRIEKRRARHLAFAKPQPVTAFVDGKQIAQQDV